MIINGGSRSNGGFFARHLMRADHNERVEVVEIRGLGAENIRDAFREMKAIASGTRCTNYFYHANINTREDELLTPEQWTLAADTLERELGLTGQARFVVAHDKDGRSHRHVVWSRIDADSMTAISDSLTYPKHESAARELEQAFGHEAVPSVLVKDRETKRPERNPQDWESLRAADSKLDPKAIKTELTGLWLASDSGAAFAAALHEHGYILTRGDRRDFCIIDQHGDDHSLARRLSGVKAAELRERMADVERDALPSVAEGRALARLNYESSSGDQPAGIETMEEPTEAPPGGAETPTIPVDDLSACHASLEEEMKAEDPGLSMFLMKPTVPPATDLEAVHNHSIASAAAGVRTLEREEAAEPGGRFERIRDWWGEMKVQFNDWRDHWAERIDHFRERWAHHEPAQEAAPQTVPLAPTPPTPGMEPEL